ncbi:hypothetical protein EMCRGX_G024485 [Ephydatia muelleri]
MAASDNLKLGDPANTCCRGPGKTAYKNVFGLSVSVMLLFCAFQGLQSLQSSINSSGGLGLVSLAILYVFFVIAGFVTPGIVKILGTKYALMGGMVCHFIYVASNYYSDWYTLIPSSILLGFASGPIWAAVSVHLTEIAVKVAPIVKETHQNLIGQFTGIFFLFFQLSQIPGNLASSLILLYSESNVISENCTNFSATMIEHKYIYILISVFLLFDIAAIVILALTVDQLPRETPFRSTKNKFQVFLLTPLIDTFKVLVNWKMFFVGFMFIMGGLEQSFIFGTFTQKYVSECVGVSRVGFMIIVLGLTSAAMSALLSRLLKYVPRFVFVIAAGLINSGLLIFLLTWKHTASYPLIFLFPIGWGIADAIWNTISSSFVGILFPRNSDPAYSIARMWLALGFVIGFIAANFGDIAARVYLLLAVAVVTVVLYLVVEVMVYLQSKRPQSLLAGDEINS